LAVLLFVQMPFDFNQVKLLSTHGKKKRKTELFKN